MLTHTWYHSTVPPGPDDDLSLAALDDDDVLDDWLASMTVGQFDRAMTLLADSLGRNDAQPHRSVWPVRGSAAV